MSDSTTPTQSNLDLDANEFFWNCSTQDLINNQIEMLCNTGSMQSIETTKNVIKSLAPLTLGPVGAVGAFFLKDKLNLEVWKDPDTFTSNILDGIPNTDLAKSLINSINPNEKFIDKGLFFRDVAKEEINNPLSSVPWIGKAAQRVGQKVNNAEDRELRKIEYQHGKINHRIYEISKKKIAEISYFLTDQGICIPARRMLIEDADFLEKSRLLKITKAKEWIKDNIFSKVIFSKSKDFLYEIKKIDQLIQHRKITKMVSKTDSQEYEVMNSNNKKFIILEKPLGSEA